MSNHWKVFLLPLLLNPLTLRATDAPASAPFLSSPQTVRAWQPAAGHRELIPWAPAKVKFELKQPGTPEALAEISAPRHPVVGIVKCPSGVPVIDGRITVEYRVPAGLDPKEIHFNLRVREVNKMYTMRLPVKAGVWQRESIAFREIVGGDRWRQGPARTATSVEVGLLTNRGPAALQFRKFTITREPSAWGPLAIPQLVTVGPEGVIRDFDLQTVPASAWLQVIAGEPAEITVNGKLLGRAGLKNLDLRAWPSAPIARAREFALDGKLKAGANRIRIKPVNPSETLLLAAVGWSENGRRTVMVSDTGWHRADGAPATVREWTGNLPRKWGKLPDIYPLLQPRVWTAQTTGQPVALRASAPRNTPVNQPVGPWKTATGKNGHWFLLTPDGKPVYFLGIQVLGLIPEINYSYYRAMMKKYASEQDFLNATVREIVRLGFNGVAPAATADSFFIAGRQAGLYNFQFLSPSQGGPFMRNYSGKEEKHWSDPFDEGWRNRYRAAARRFGDRWRHDPALIGVYVNNEIPLDGSVNGGSVTGYLYSDACRKAFAAWLTKRYDGNLDRLKDAWKHELPAVTGITDFSALTTLDLSSRPGNIVSAEDGHAAPRQFRNGKGPLHADLYDFAVYAMGVYADFMLETLRRELPGKLIASNRFMGNATDEMLAAWKNYDLIAWNAYPFSHWQKGLYSQGQLNHLRRANRATGKPVIISEIGLQALDARLPNPSAQLYTQKQRGEEYGKLLRQVYDELPFVVGFTLFAWQNLPDTERQSWGLVDNEGNLYTDYANAVEQANRQLMEAINR